MTQPRLLVICPSAYTLGGLATWLDYFLPGVRQYGFDVTLGLVSGPRYHNPDEYLWVHPFEDVEEIKCGGATQYSRTAAVRRAVQRVKPDIVLTVNIPDALKATALERQAGRNVRAVMTCHGIQEDLFNDMSAMHDEIDAVVCTNRLACELAVRMGKIPSERVYHCAYGVHSPNLVRSSPRASSFTIGFSGRLEQPQKRIFDLVDVAEILRESKVDFKMLIAGSGPQELDFKGLIRQRNLESAIKFLGCLDASEMNERLYSASDVLLVTSSWETGPIVIWEAMAAGTPVVSSRYIGSGLESLLWNEQNCLMFDVGDVQSAARQLLVILENLEIGNRLREAGLRAVEENLSVEASLQTWNRVLREVLSKDPICGPVRPVKVDRGRLTRAFGPRAASFIRRALKGLPPDTGPGGEWPHTLAASSMPEAEFLRLAAELDRRPASLRGEG